MDQYCITCHNEKLKTGGLALDGMDVEHVGKAPEIWEKVIRKIRAGLMPPSGRKRPERSALEAFATNVENRLDSEAALHPNPGDPGLHRLNRTEYANVIRDLLALNVDVSTLLPADNSSDGFDNIADSLGFSPSLIQGYLSAAMKISRSAVGDPTHISSTTTYLAPAALAQDRHIEGLPLGTRGGMLITHNFPLDGEYEFAVTANGVAGAGRGNGGLVGGGGDGFGGNPGAAEAAPVLNITLDNQRLTTPNPRSFRVPVMAGPHALAVALIDRRPSAGAGVDDIYSVYSVQGAVNNIVISGPLNPAGVGQTPSRKKIFICYPKAASDESACARKILSTLARRAFRQTPTAAEIDSLVQFYEQSRKDGDFETGIQDALARLLVAPRFLFRLEQEPAGITPGRWYNISAFDLASRLSFFLWSTIPDDELLDVAGKGLLTNPAVLEKQVRRMLADPKSNALISNFAGQWLYLRDLANAQPMASNFDDNLRLSLRKETELLFESILREDRSILTLLNADYTYVDERLASHYGIPSIRGSYFRRVTLDPSSPRRGLLGQGSFLTVSSIATRTSPVIRGKWVLENLLGSPPPNPPPGVEINLDDPEAMKVTTLRQRLEKHRASPVCASCHRMMDPIGLALENFDLVGTWREADGKLSIDANGELVDGTPLHGISDLRNAVLSRSELFVSTATEKLMTYALGRTIESYDMPTVRAIVKRAARNDYKFSSIILGVVESPAFKMKMKQPADKS
jgi:uncharacterized protein DUF1592/uncharacterized protein DUF1588/uncharacterized protein DUF1587/uncharacterized protein DUF1585/uncharacterized protein DUF1595